MDNGYLIPAPKQSPHPIPVIRREKNSILRRAKNYGQGILDAASPLVT